MELLSVTERPINPKQNANILSKIFFWWTVLVIKNAYGKKYEPEDIPSPLPQDSSEILGDKLEKAWIKELNNSKILQRRPSLLKTLVRVFWKEFIQISVLHSINEFFISIAQQVFLSHYLVYLKKTKGDQSLFHELEIIGAVLISSYGLNLLFTKHVFVESSHLGCRIKVALSSLMFRKCLRMGNNNTEGDTSAGRVLNLMSNDLARFDNIIMRCNYAYSALISTLIISMILCSEVSLFATIMCLSSVLLPTPIQVFISTGMAKFRAKIAKASDERIRLMDEIICGIQIIKMYAWEKPYAKLLIFKRRIEMKWIGRALLLRDMRGTINLTLSKFTLYAFVVTYSLRGGKVVPEVVYAVLGYCGIIVKVMNGMFFQSLGEFSECSVSIKRIQTFLELNEMKRPNITIEEKTKNAIEFHNVRCSWNLDSNQETLKNITLNIEAYKLTIVMGSVGAGKSSLLSVILGELPINEGSMKLNGSISYYSQIPWIFAGTVRKNIIFCEEYNAEKYKKVIEACALKHDFDSFPDADLTLVGERGVTLSGGQKARVALARTVYKMADIYLLDDPLSALDTHISKQIFQKCILDLLNGKTCILISHQSQYLTQSNQVVLLQEGKIEYQGTFDQLTESDTMYANIFKKTDFDDDNCDSEPDGTKDVSKFVVVDEKHDLGKKNCIADNSTKNANNLDNKTNDEENEIVTPNVLFQFIKRGAGIGAVILIFCLFVLSQVILSGLDLWLAYWTSVEVEASSEDVDKFAVNRNEKKWYFLFFETSTNGYFIAGYSAILCGIMLVAGVRNYLFVFYGKKCSQKAHNDAFYSVLGTTSSFFHNNPSGRILNRFSKDLGVVDEILFPSLMDATWSMFQIVAAFVVSASINVAYIVPAIIIFALLFAIRNYYVRVSTNLKRLESITRSPVFVHLHSTLQGLPVIRAGSSDTKWVHEFDRQQDIHTSAWYLYNMTAFCYTFYLEAVCFIYLAVIVIGSFFLNLSGSQVGLAFSQSIFLVTWINLAMRTSAEVSNHAVSVDRLLWYSTLSPEKQPSSVNSAAKNWPSKGKIIFDNVSFRYDISSNPALRKISFIVESEEKIGIVGRTGAGKTSILAALFRLGYVDGSIIIDDVNTNFVRLEKLRSSISVIPQDPILFSGTLRRNLDPFGEYNDDSLWEALEDAQLKKVITGMDEMGLDTLITEGGKNFSVGQRQLICLARAIIRNNRILILDEATASVDEQTDIILRKIIKDNFQSCTVLTIAHRLNTVADSDKILVMDGGTIVEYGHPYKLLCNQASFYYKLVSEMGEFEQATLIDIAKKNYSFIEEKPDDNCT